MQVCKLKDYYINYPLFNNNIAKGQNLSNIARLLKSRQNAFISAIVSALKLLEALIRIKGILLFNPTRVLSRLISRIKCDILTTRLKLELIPLQVTKTYIKQ